MIEYKKIKEIAEIIRTGKTPPTQEQKYFNGGINWYSPGDLNNGKFLSESSRKISELAIYEKKAVLFPPKTLLIGCIGDIGKIGITSNESSSNQQLTGIFPNDTVNVEYLYYWFFANKKKLENYSNNAVVPILNNATLEKIQIPLPPLEEQKRIAAILDAADLHRQKTKELINKYDELAQALFLDMFGDPVTNPKGWEVKSLNSLSSKIGSGATPKGGKEAYYESGISLIRSLNVHDNLFKMKDLAYIDEIQAKKLSNVQVESNDVLFNITGASVCRCTIVPENILPARVNQHVAIIRPRQSLICPTFLMYLLISPNTKQTLLSIGGKGGATREAITKTDLESYRVICPPIGRQNKFMETSISIEKQKAQAEANLQKAEELFQSLLQKAFKGEL
jgi:type I restriction enzyme S subunit